MAGNTGRFNFPFPRNKFFTGRDEFLKQIYTNFDRGERIQAINGLGGLGKTQAAIEYAHRYHERYKIVFWGNAHSREPLVSDFAAMAGCLNLPEKNAEDQSQAVDAVKSWFEKNAGWLLILDSADDLEMAREFIPSSGAGHVLLTSRAQHTGALAVRNPIEKMRRQEGALFLLRRLRALKEGEPLESAAVNLRTQAETLSEALDGLPLALDQAAAYVEAKPSTLEEYQAHYRSERTRLLSDRGALPDSHPESVAITFSLAFKRVAEASPAAADLLCLCAFLDADAIPEELFSIGGEELGENLSAIATNPVSLIETIEEAGRYSLLQRDPEKRTVYLNRLVQTTLKDGMDAKTRRAWADRAVRAINEAFPSVEYGDWPTCERLVPHAQAITPLIDEYGFEFPKAAQIMNAAGSYLYKRAQYAEAEHLLTRALGIREKALNPGDPEIAFSLNDLAELYQVQAKYAEAEAFYQRALSISEKALGPEHKDVAISLNNLAMFYDARGRYTEAEPLSIRALAISEKALGPEHPHVATCLDNLAGLYHVQGRFAEAEPLYHRALSLREKLLDSEHPDVAVSLNNLATFYYDQLKKEEAEPFMKRALAIREQALGPEHPDVATSLYNLAMIYRDQGKYAEAEALHQRALGIRVKVFGQEHPVVVQSLDMLAKLYGIQGKYAEAEPLLRRALEIREKTLRPDHPDLVQIISDLAGACYLQRKYEEVELLLKRFVLLLEKTLGPDHLEVAKALESYAFVLQIVGKSLEAEEAEARASTIRARHSVS
jgi:tetratricopeptide (TPR) repeat protein